LLYISIVGFSIALSLLLRKASITQNYTLAILGIILALYLKSVLPRIIVEPDPVLVWDDKVRTNVIESIIRNGYYPFDLAGSHNSMYRDEHILYPTAFILAAITSIVTSLDVTTIFTSPIVIFALLIVFIIMSTLLMKRNILFGWIAAISLGLNFVTIGYMYPYIYSQVARVFIALLFYMMLVKNNEKSISFSDLSVCAVFTALIPLTHSSESVAFFIAIITLSLVLALRNFMFRNREARQYPNKFFALFIMYLVTFLVWNAFQATYIAQDIYSMLIHSFEWALKTEITESVARFTPYDYTPLEILTIMSGVLSYGIILLISAFDTLASSLKRWENAKKLENLIMVVLIIIAVINAYIWLETPYKKDITWRFAFVFFTLVSIFFTSKRGISTKYIKRIWHNWGVLLAVLLGLFISSMYIYLRFQNIASDYNLFSLKMRHVLDDSKIVELLRNSRLNRYSIVFVDSPNVPYYIFRDYIVVRMPITRYIIAVDSPYIQYYKHRLLSGIQMYRFVLLSKSHIKISDRHTLVDKAIILHEPSIMNISKTSNMLYNNVNFAISATY